MNFKSIISSLSFLGQSRRKSCIEEFKRTLEEPSRRTWDVSYRNGNYIAVLKDDFVISNDEKHALFTESLKSFGDQFYVDGKKIKCRVKDRHLPSLVNIIKGRGLEFMRVINNGVVDES